MKQTAEKPFSDQLEMWLKKKGDKTIAGLSDVFRDKSFAITFLLLMILPATPLPTGGLTHVFEVIVVLLCLEVMIGRQTIWLPEKWRHKHLGDAFTGKVIPKVMKYIRWFEKYSSPRGRIFFRLPLVPRLLALVIMLFTLTALFAIPFSGLDTLPSLGVVLISLAIILDDIYFLAAGTVVGAIGLGLVIALGGAGLHAIQHFLGG
jgi:hypothetical protein